ncbi:MAG: hypothetical protein ABIP65_11955 [Vicinamibacterales bacterium]
MRALVWLSGGNVRWRTIQMVLDSGYVDAYRSTHASAAGFTFPTWEPHVRLDYMFLPQRDAARLQSCEVMDVPGAREASDHLPLLSVVEMPETRAIASPPHQSIGHGDLDGDEC